MQYCKNCGRQLKDGMRFCDRCGQSVRKSRENGQAARHKEIEELREERLNRKKRLAEKEERQRTAREKRRKSRGRRAAIYIFVLLLITLASVLVGYFFFAGKSGGGNESAPGVITEQTVTAAPVQTAAPAQSGEYAEITVGNVRCPYPAAFHSGSASGNVKMSLTDPLGGAKMVISQEVIEGELTELAKGYLSQIGATSATEMKSNDSESSYTVTAEVNGTVYHRKCVVRNKLAVYYDFEYSASSGSASAYQKYIETIDSRFK